MVRFWTPWVLGLCLFTQSLTAKEIAGEWILTIDAPRNWEKVLKSLHGGVRLIRFLGKSKRHALVFTRGRLRRIPRRFVTAIQPNYLYQTLEETEDPSFNASWALRNEGQMVSNWGTGVPGVDLRANDAWQISSGSEKIKVAILDTGLNINHEDLQNNIRPQSSEIIPNGQDDDLNGWVDDPLGWDFIHHSNLPHDDNGHGTFCSGIIGADWGNGKGSRGLLERVTLLPVKVLDYLGQGSTATAIEGIDYALRSGAKIINMSWGGRQFDPALFQEIKTATHQGILFVAAAGNSSGDNDDPNEAIYPASFPLEGLISVTAYDPKGIRAEFSQFGKQRVSIGAPGVEIFSTELSGYGYRSGTSFATPYVSGVAALIKTIFPGMSGQELQKRILETGEPLHFYEKNFTQTGKLVNALNATLGKVPIQPLVPQGWERINHKIETPHPYLPETDWKIRIVEPGAKFIRLHFKKFETEKKYDRVTLRDQTGTVVYRYSGALSSFTSAEALGDEVQVEFSSDYNRQQYGFEIDYIEASY